MILFLFLVIWLMASSAQATVYVNLDLESSTVNAALANGSTHDGSTLELFSGDAAYPSSYTRNALTPPSGSRYFEVLTICGGYSANRCTPAGDPSSTTIQAQIGFSHTSINWPSRSGETFYLGGFFRFDRVNSRNVWIDDTFDKLWEFGGNGGAHSTRWGIGSGRHGNFSGWSAADKFTFDLWCADSVFGACEVPASNDWDHKPHNANGYSASNPYECDYGRWYAVVLAVTMSTTTSGHISLYINGTLVHDSDHITMDSGSASDSVQINGTIAQSAYDAPDHYRRADKLMLTDSLTDVQNAGLMEDPEAGGGGGSTVVMFLNELMAVMTVTLQWGIALGYLWERRAAMVRALYAIHAYYWTLRYRYALHRWQKQAPLMLDAPLDVIDLENKQDVWHVRTQSHNGH